ncbi:MAG: hypothetical protein LAO30_17445 [Acidobacteriia bacterium]|nr:hypothetical protein [Terriglobia bacterium]
MLEIAANDPVTSPRAVLVESLVELATQGLPPMFYPEKNVFCHRLNRTPQGLEKEGISRRYTLMTLLGLHKARAAGFHSDIDIDGVLTALGMDTNWIDNLGDLGLYLWTCARLRPDSLRHIVASFDLKKTVDQFPDGCERRTMELAWFLTGLTYLKLSGQPGLPDFTDLTHQIYQLVKDNQGSRGAFGHLATRGSSAGRFRGRIGSFADQVYPIYAFSKFGQTFGVRDALQHATDCAHVICGAQGPLGQWWWHYDSVTSKVISKHPVYSVHQEAMGPMALFSLSEATGEDFSTPIFTGLDWIVGKNELNLDMRDQRHHLVWRSFYQGRFRSYSNNVLNFVGLPSSAAGLKVRYECRPYELGWLLYAFADR